jgi:hypothetical protein
MKNPSNPIGNQTRDLPDCSAVPQPTAPPRAAKKERNGGIKRGILFPHSQCYPRRWSWDFESRLHAIHLLSAIMNDDIWHLTEHRSSFPLQISIAVLKGYLWDDVA